MNTEHNEAEILVEVDSHILRMIEKYHNEFLGNRLGEVGNAENIYGQEGRQAGQAGGEVRVINQRAISG